MSVPRDHACFFLHGPESGQCCTEVYSQTFSVEIQYVCLLKPGILACQNR